MKGILQSPFAPSRDLQWLAAFVKGFGPEQAVSQLLFLKWGDADAKFAVAHGTGRRMPDVADGSHAGTRADPDANTVPNTVSNIVAR